MIYFMKYAQRWTLLLLFMFGALLGQAQNTAKLSLMTALPSGHLHKMVSDSSLQASLQQFRPNIRLGMIDFSEERLALVKLLDSLEVPMTAWLLLPAEEGMQLSWKQSQKAKERYEQLLQWSHEHKINWTGIAMAITPDGEEEDWMAKRKSRYAEQLFSRMYEEEELQESKRNYQNLIHQIQADGYLVELYVPAYHIDAKKADSQAMHWITGVPYLEADRLVPMVYAGNDQSLVRMASYSGENAVQEICLVIPSQTSRPSLLEWVNVMPLIKEAGSNVKEITLYISGLSKTSEFIPNLADFNWEGTSSLSEGELAEVKKQRKKIQRLFDLLRYPKLLLLGAGIFIILAIVAFIRLLARVLS